MKLIFTKIESTKDYIEVSYNNGKSWTTYNKANALANGINLTEEQSSDIEQISFKGGIKKPSDISVKVSIGNAFSESYVINSDGGFGFNGDIIIPDSATSIVDRAFHSCSGLTSVTIPDSVTSIGERAFFGCNSLTSVTFGDSVNSIGVWAFYNCSNLTSVTIPNSVTSIGEKAFYCCTSLTSVTFGNSVTSIGQSVFYGCTGLTSVTIPSSVTSIGQSVFYSCTGLTFVTIPSSVTSIGQYAFSGCSSLTTINYTGTEEQWNAITKGSSWNSKVPSTCVINYNYQD